MKVYFMGGNDHERLICETDNKLPKNWGDFSESEESHSIIKFIKDHKFDSYYWNIWFDDEINRWHIDVGSWSQWFEIGK